MMSLWRLYRRRNVLHSIITVILLTIFIHFYYYHVHQYYIKSSNTYHQSKVAFNVLDDEIRYDLLLSHSLYYSNSYYSNDDTVIWTSLYKNLIKRFKYKVPHEGTDTDDTVTKYYIGDAISWLNDDHHSSDNVTSLLSICPDISNDISDVNAIDSIVIFETCVPGFDTITIDTIYSYYDKLLEYITFLRRKYYGSVIMWSKPNVPKDSSIQLRVLHQYLILKHLIHDNGVLVIQPDMMVKERVVPFLLYHNVYDAIQYQLQYMNINSKEGLKLLSSSLSSLSSSSSSSSINLSIHKNDQRLATICNPLLNTRKYDERCFPYPEQLLPLLITGLGGSGTHEIANTLRSRGVRVRHEQIDADGTVSWFHAVNDNYGNTPYPHYAALDNANYFSPRFTKVIHVIRCPVKQISSFTTHLHESYKFVYEHMMLMKTTWGAYMKHEDETVKMFIPSNNCNRGEKCNLHFSALSWLFWNDHVHSYADVTFHVESIDELVSYICTNIVCDVNTNINNDNSLWYYIIRTVRSKIGLKNKQRDIVSSSEYHKKHHEYNIQQIASEAGTNIAAHIHTTSSKIYGYGEC